MSNRPLKSISAFSMLEVMISVAILATALSFAIGTIFTLHQSRGALEEEQKVQAVAQILVERLQGARWDDLGRNVSDYAGDNAWSWHRRATTQAVNVSANQPPAMTEQATNSHNNLLQLGLLTAPSGVKNLNIYLEYYKGELLESLNALLANDATLDARTEWLKAVGDPIQNLAPNGALAGDTNLYLEQDPSLFNLKDVKSAVIMRVLISWESTIGGTRWHEVVVGRRN